MTLVRSKTGLVYRIEAQDNYGRVLAFAETQVGQGTRRLVDKFLVNRVNHALKLIGVAT